MMGINAKSPGKLISRISDAFEDLPSELKNAARYVTSNPREVAFRSMRTVATAAAFASLAVCENDDRT